MVLFDQHRHQQPLFRAVHQRGFVLLHHALQFSTHEVSNKAEFLLWRGSSGAVLREDDHRKELQDMAHI